VDCRKFIREFKVQRTDILISFDVVSLFTNVPISEALPVIRNKLSLDDTLPNQSSLQNEDIMELLEVCVRTTYFQVEDRFYQQKSGMAIESSLSPIVSNIFMEHSEQLALDSVPHKPAMWLRYLDEKFVVWPHGTEKLKEFLSHINSLRPTIQFTTETETGNSLSFLDVLVCRNETALLTKIYRKPTHIGRYLHFNSNHPPHIKRGVMYSLINRAITLCIEKQEYAKVVED
jgi:hypothetical protein